ncbi:MAG: hypothetical protein ACK559_08470, partial [bacterium]
VGVALPEHLDLVDLRDGLGEDEAVEVRGLGASGERGRDVAVCVGDAARGVRGGHGEVVGRGVRGGHGARDRVHARPARGLAAEAELVDARAGGEVVHRRGARAKAEG